jgi:hypothetical protein
VCYEHRHAFLRVNKRTHCNSCSKCLPSALKQTSGLLERLFDTSLSSLTLIDVIVSQMLCISSFIMWGLFEYTLFLLGFPTDKNERI